HIGHFFIAINIESFTELDTFKKTTGDILRELRASKLAPGQERIYTAGEKEYIAWQYRKDKGVPLNEAIQRDIIQLKNDYNLNQYEFDFE
ncbi:MAG TPA: lactate dehydrogenase, partial [Clostridiales bacterium]|nr:lactate dehydrogenase [Clostridiales bacterium]